MEVIGDYEYSLKEVLGHGSFAQVYRGNHRQKPQIQVAVKAIIKKSLAKSQNLLGKEIKILKELTELHHENVVALLDCKESQTNVFLIMEYCNGGDLGDYLQAKGTLSEDTIRVFLTQIAGALKALHNKGIVHRDLKPQNILLSHSGNRKDDYPHPSKIRLKIADFGFARFLQDGMMAVTLCGSPMYMAPEVIMSLKYDAKADLWSVGTIVFQCLTGKAPFQANTPQQLRNYYEKNNSIMPKIPPGTSQELADLLIRLLRRNSKDRMSFEEFFSHKFLQRPEIERSDSPLGADFVTVSMLPPTYVSPQQSPTAVLRYRHSSSPPKVVSPPHSTPESPRSNRINMSSSIDDDFVIVPPLNDPLPEEKNPTLVRSASPLSRGTREHEKPIGASPKRPTFSTEPVPVPTQRANYEKMTSNLMRSRGESTSSCGSPGSVGAGSVPRSQPINVRGSPESKAHVEIDVSSFSPPSVKFMIGTPPGNRRRSTSGSSLCDMPNYWTSPRNTPLRRSGRSPSVEVLSNQFQPTVRLGSSPPIVTGPLARMPVLSSPNLNDNNNVNPTPILPFCTRAVTLPDISERGSTSNSYSNYLPDTVYNSNESLILPFCSPPELSEETLLDKVHNDTLAKISFVDVLTNTILDIANQREDPLMFYRNHNVLRRAEQLALYVRALQLMSSALTLAMKEIKCQKLTSSSTVKRLVKTLNTKFKTTCRKCRGLVNDGLLHRPETVNMCADKLLYQHAIEMSRLAAADELLDKSDECFSRYHVALIIFHGLASIASSQEDKDIFNKLKEAIEKRLKILQEKGFVYSEEPMM